MGIGNLQSALRAYGDGDVSYARLYFDSTPLRHARRLPHASRRSATTPRRTSGGSRRRGDHAPVSLRSRRSSTAISALQNAKNSAEEVLHPRRRDAAVRDARRSCARPTTTARSSRCRRRRSPRTASRSTPGWASSPARLGQRTRAVPRAARAGAGAARRTSARASKRDLRRAAARRDEHRARRALPARCCCKTNREATRELLAAHDRLGVRHPAQLPLRARRRWRSSSCSSGCSRSTSSPGCASRPRST